MNAKTLAVQGVVCTHSGYGQLLCETVAGLSARGWRIQLKPLRIEENCEPIPWEIRSKITPTITASWELTIASMAHPCLPTPGKKSIYWTMWEQDRLSRWQSAILNNCEAVLVPNSWLKTVFGKSVTTPIYVVPLGIHREIFQPSPITDGPCIFGAAGALNPSAKRKNLNAIVRAFNLVFTGRTDAELRLKVMPGEGFPVTGQNITVFPAYMDWIGLARWFQGLTAFVNAGPEGHGLLAHQAMACGRPLISPYYGGVTSFMTPANGYPAEYMLHACQFGNPDAGSFLDVDELSLAEEMHRVYLDRQEAAEKGAQAAIDSSRLTWDNSITALERALNSII